MNKAELRNRLKAEFTAPPAAPANEFWAEFRARAAAAPATPVERSRPLLLTHGWRQWSMAAACLVVGAFVAVPLLTSPEPRPTPEPGTVAIASVSPAQTGQELSQVDEVDVLTDYGSLMIVEDTKNGGTLVWLTGLGAPPGEGG